MILGYSSLYPADASERDLPGPAEARALLAGRRPDIVTRIEGMVARATAGAGAPRHLDAILLGIARIGRRHGSFGDDPHDYHNEEHVLELAERRLGALMDAIGEPALPADDWLALMLFAACHDLRQREAFDVPGPVGGNEAASIAEGFRILAACGLDPVAERPLYIALELMIAGSTFDARPPQRSDDPDVPAAPGGSLARGLALWLDGERPDWRDDPDARRGERLARLAADLDTANVGEPFPLLADSAVRLCRERERRAGRALAKASSALTCLGFLSRGQTVYFFDLHRFCSREGERAFGPQKARNGPVVRQVSQQLQDRFEDQPPGNGQAVIDAFAALCAATG
ncbi:hypothetical protein [Arenimonas composti]|uniref:Uncharacterized protein n=1 Tax=Arenimonas composti TR7-09 = DSM 18010 TaxID=1121013 RepID=A0A091BFJ5_9GAMM|nr:hypothetical protein [Arenimonas composti]KFN49584.1 hypothetical protein P873_10545 [Arenimonas composti TR7-09 = DSM 18010]